MRAFDSIYRRRRLFVLIWVLVGLALLPLVFTAGREVVIQSRLGTHDELIERYAREHGLEPRLVEAVIRVESKGDPNAVSGKGARGLMQLTPITVKEIRQRFDIEGDVMDPATNIRMGTRYLAYLLDRFDGDRTLALAAYHMGPTRVARLRRANRGMSSAELVRRFAGPQTRHYVKSVLALAA